MERQVMIDRLMWLTADSGLGYGIPSFTNMLIQSSMTPSKPEDDWKSVVAIKGPADKYTDKELEKLVAFSDAYTADYDTRWRVRMGANLIIMDKVTFNWTDPPTTRWLRKRQSWERGMMHSDTIDEAIAHFSKDLHPTTVDA